VFCTKFGGEFHSALRGCLGRIKDPLGEFHSSQAVAVVCSLFV
jgi:hypothetical protein